MRIIIDYPDDASVHLALAVITAHVREGRISESAGVPHFCWASIFNELSLRVSTRRKKHGQKSDSLLIYRSESND